MTYSIEQMAKRFDVSRATVRAWIAGGELQAICVSRSRNSKKPRLRITDEAIAQFELLRGVLHAAKPPSRNRRRREENVVKFY